MRSATHNRNRFQDEQQVSIVLPKLKPLYSSYSCEAKMRFFSNMSVKAKLLGAFLTVSTMLGAVSGFTLFQLSETNDRVGIVYNENLLPIG